MRIPLFTVANTGLLTSFQDTGRIGFLRKGISPAGAMDQFALKIANILVGNTPTEACIEITMIGPTLIAKSETIIAICGADLSPKVNGKAASMWKSFLLRPNDILTFGAPKEGTRAYLAVAGGFDIPTILGSKSYDSKASIGTPINKNDFLYGFRQTVTPRIGLSPDFIPTYDKYINVRVIPGPHEANFKENSIRTFYNSIFTISRGDRMGIYVEGHHQIQYLNSADIYSDSIPFGGIQIPNSKKPIILMADRQVTGGYTRIGTIITVDLWKVAQLPLGGKISFERCSVADAQQLLKKENLFIKQLQMESLNLLKIF